MDNLDKAWLSGFIDGEGHVGIHPVKPSNAKKTYYSACCFLRNTHYESMVHVSNLLGELLGREVKIGTEKRARGKDSYYINISAHLEVRRLASAVRPYTITKVKQWDLIYEYVQSRLSAVGHKRPYTNRELEILEEISSLNRRWSEE